MAPSVVPFLPYQYSLLSTTCHVVTFVVYPGWHSGHNEGVHVGVLIFPPFQWHAWNRKDAELVTVAITLVLSPLLLYGGCVALRSIGPRYASGWLCSCDALRQQQGFQVVCRTPRSLTVSVTQLRTLLTQSRCCYLLASNFAPRYG